MLNQFALGSLLRCPRKLRQTLGARALGLRRIRLRVGVVVAGRGDDAAAGAPGSLDRRSRRREGGDGRSGRDGHGRWPLFGKALHRDGDGGAAVEVFLVLVGAARVVLLADERAVGVCLQGGAVFALAMDAAGFCLGLGLGLYSVLGAESGDDDGG